MAENSRIEWTDHTVNFWIGCTRVSPACDHCYAERDWSMTGRFARVEWGPHGERSPTKDPMREVARIAAGAAKRGRRERVFINSLSDWADNHKSISDDLRASIFDAARLHPGLDLILLTKRPQNIARYLPGDWGDGYRNVWLGVTAENQEEADRRIPILLATPAAVRWVSAEPLLGPVDFREIAADDVLTVDALTGIHSDDENGPITGVVGNPDPHIDWIVVGGESGPGARPMQVGWARTIVEQCKASGTKCFVKQLGADPVWEDGAFLNLRDRKGGDPSEWPEDLRIQQLPWRFAR